MGLLVTNDDGPPGPAAPYVEPFARALGAAMGEPVFACTPAMQQSWISKAMTIGEVAVEVQEEKDGVQWATVAGTPATTANIALNHLAPFSVSLVVSGPNLGQNAGASFIASSGTIGAAFEAAMLGYKTVAVSFGYDGSPSKHSTADVVASCAVAVNIIQTLVKSWPTDCRPILYSINVPLGCTMTTPVYATRVMERGYRDVYQKQDNGVYCPKRVAFNKEAPFGTDRWALNEGLVSVTPLYSSSLEEAPLQHVPYPIPQ